MISVRVSLVVFFACLIGAGATTAGAAPRTLSLEDFRQAVSVRSPQLSPGGNKIVYVRSRVDWKNDRYDTELVLVDVATGASRVLTRERLGVAKPRWSPDGSKIAYLAQPEEKKPPQIYVLPMNGGDSQKISDAKQGVDGLAWRPDSAALAYVCEDAPNQRDLKRHLDAVLITDEDYLTEKAPQPAHLWMVDADGTNDARLNAGQWSVVKGSDPVWSPDGTRIFYQRQPDPIFAHFVQQTTYAYDVRSKQDEPLNLGVDSDPRISPDGTLIAVTTPRHGSLYLQDDVSARSLVTGKELFSSRTLDRNVHWFAWLAQGGGLAIGSSDGVRDVLWTLSDHGTPFKVQTGDVDVAPDASIARDGGIAFVGERRDRLPDIYYLAAGSNVPKRLSDENSWLNGYAIARSTQMQWTLDNGMTAYGVLTYPIGYVVGRKYPLVLDIHGGPVSTSTWNMSGLEGGTLAQVLGADGFLVLRPNYRGSDNEGDAFLQAIVGDVTSGPGRDNLAAVEAVRKMGIVDESRIGVSGWSGGGLQTSWLIGHANFWRAAVSGAAVNDWYQQALLADINENFAQTFFAGVLPFSKQGKADYAAQSPITYAARVKTPTLILSDTRDQRVPVSQAYTFYHALRDRGVPVKFTAFPRYGHFPSDPVGREQALRAWSDWFVRWMK